MDFSKLAPLLGRTLVIVAHPDDETITCGGLLQRMRDPCVVFATDGAPEDAHTWGRFGSRERSAAIREQEARARFLSRYGRRLYITGTPKAEECISASWRNTER
ncbi:MAG: hypothetical protein DMG63_13230 [Acidobacteria bacterium]|nr:MAG: hypothetical protein DMG63_13230 [Acidobacteriota bacterium]